MLGDESSAVNSEADAGKVSDDKGIQVGLLRLFPFPIASDGLGCGPLSLGLFRLWSGYRRCVARQEKNFLYITVLSTGFPLFDRVLLYDLARRWCFVWSGLIKIVEILLFDVQNDIWPKRFIYICRFFYLRS